MYERQGFRESALPRIVLGLSLQIDFFYQPGEDSGVEGEVEVEDAGIALAGGFPLAEVLYLAGEIFPEEPQMVYLSGWEGTGR